MLEVLSPGLRSLVQDQGRPGHAALGISAGGAWDRAAQDLANRLVGNESAAGVLEVLMGGARFRAHGDLLVAVTGAPVPVTVDGRPVDLCTPLVLRSGQEVAMGAPSTGLRSYLAVRGGLEARRVFGSVSSDPTRGMGPAPLRAGDELALGGFGTRTMHPTHLAPSAWSARRELVLHAVLGPRDDWFTAVALHSFATTAWTVTDQTDRVGTRLDGPALERARAGELASEGMVRGAVQVPTSGQPLVFGPDHPTTGGYPVIAVVDGPDADLLAQAAPGQVVRFVTRRVRIELA